MRLWIFAIVAVVAFSAPAAAQEAEPESIEEPVDEQDEMARQLFDQGRSAYSEGRFESALRAFRASYELSGRAQLLFNMGTTLDRLRRTREAVNHFERYLEEMYEAPNRSEVEARIRVLRAELDQQRAAAADRDLLTAELRAEREARRAAEAEDDTVFEKWWFWTIVGSVVVAGVIIAAIVFPIETLQGPEVGSTGLVTTTLEWP